MALKFGFWSEQETQVGHSYSRRLHELVDEAILAEKFNFDFVALSEQHVALGGISSSAPEVVFGYLAAKTTRIRLRGAVMLMPKKINHPLRTAERVSVLDILSNGRFELYCGRANTTIAMRAFNVDPAETQEQLEEGLDVIRSAMRNDIFTHQGKNYQIPPRMLVPKPLQKPHPPIGIAATSLRSHVWAGQQGLGVMSSNLYQGWEAQAKLIKAYRDAWTPDPGGPAVRASVGVPIFIGIGKTDQEAKEKFAGPLMHYAQISTDAYPRLAKIADDYAYMGENNEALQRAATDWDYLLNESGTTVCGSPETVIRQIQKFVDLGVDEVIFHLDSVPHEMIMEAMELLGRFVIPHFRDRNNVVRPTDEILDTIRAMRPKAIGAVATAAE
jgi:alkanesulfonate monooxygenase SsuD/methylene tetrahydromethanopterin reductase-like flavin-dependent oxidoreductase (luciferase family)